MDQGAVIATHTPRRSVPGRVALQLALAASALAWGILAHAQAVPDPAQALQEVLVIGSTPLSGAAMDIDKIPGNVQVLSAEDLSRQGTPSLTTALDSRLSSININDNIDDPFQPDILYRGFEASPILGTPQGLAVYQNGVRINEAFGNTVNWDLLPDIAINQVELVSYSPLYGLNALGGAVSVTMKNAFTYRGADLEVSAGSYGKRAAVGQFGVTSGMFGLYVAGKALEWDGWRRFSSDRIGTLFAVLSMHSDRGTLDLSYARADNTLNGQSAAPVQELAVNRSLTFTGPQSNLNRLNFFILNGAAQLASHWSLQGVAYYRDYAQSVANGNTTDYMACVIAPGILCQPDGLTPLMNAAGQSLPDISEGGTVPIGENDFETIRSWGRGITLEISDHAPILGRDNQFSLGAAIDYAATSFYSGAEIGVIDSRLQVLPSGLVVNTPEDSPGAIANGDAVPVSVNSVNKNLGAYFTDTLNVTPELALTASGRYNVANIDLTDQLGTNLTGSNRYVHLNPAVGATYKVAPTMTVYGGWATNNRTPTASEIECSDPLTPCLLPTNLSADPPTLRQVISHTSELGVRGRLPWSHDSSGGLTYNLSVFRTVLHDDIFGIATSVSQGFFQNIGETRRQGVELGLAYHTNRWSGFFNYSLVQATFESALLVPSPSNPYQDANGDIQVEPGDRLPGIPEHRLKVGVDVKVIAGWSIGATLNTVSSFNYVGDESNQLAPLPGYAVVNLHTTWQPASHVELFASINNLLNRKYATWGILSDPTGVGAPGVPPDGVTNGPGVDNRFQSPAPPFMAFAGVRLML